MYKMMQATYEKGKLLLTEELETQLEGQRLYVVIFKANDHEHKKERFLGATANPSPPSASGPPRGRRRALR
jgi:hypothetical protein